jgi:hypothetical protein
MKTKKPFNMKEDSNLRIEREKTYTSFHMTG